VFHVISAASRGCVNKCAGVAREGFRGQHTREVTMFAIHKLMMVSSAGRKYSGGHAYPCVL
jgi:hypothetical protein